MGKESFGPKRKFEIVASVGNRAYKQYNQLAHIQQWSCPTAFASLKDVTEDGSVLVVIRADGFESTTVCKGLKQVGNTYASLIKKLREDKLLPRNKSNVRFLIKTGIIWVPADEVNGEFNSGSFIMAVANSKVTKPITKVK